MTLTAPQLRLARSITIYQVWWEGSPFFDGNANYIDLETAKLHAAFDYEGEEYGHPDEDDEGANIRPDFTWVEERGVWHLIDHGKDTLVQVIPETVWRPATQTEVEAQDALEAVRAKQWSGMPMAEALEKAAADYTEES